MLYTKVYSTLQYSIYIYIKYVYRSLSGTGGGSLFIRSGSSSTNVNHSNSTFTYLCGATLLLVRISVLPAQALSGTTTGIKYDYSREER